MVWEVELAPRLARFYTPEKVHVFASPAGRDFLVTSLTVLSIPLGLSRAKNW
jgi:hypothetical protein